MTDIKIAYLNRDDPTNSSIPKLSQEQFTNPAPTLPQSTQAKRNSSVPCTNEVTTKSLPKPSVYQESYQKQPCSSHPVCPKHQQLQDQGICSKDCAVLLTPFPVRKEQSNAAHRSVGRKNRRGVPWREITRGPRYPGYWTPRVGGSIVLLSRIARLPSGCLDSAE